jgi:hypothetical protein
MFNNILNYKNNCKIIKIISKMYIIYIYNMAGQNYRTPSLSKPTSDLIRALVSMALP